MRFVLRLVAAIVLAVALGLGSAYLAVKGALPADTTVKNGAWTASLAAGGTNADNYTRTAVAIAGLLALNKDETIYYGANADSAGEPLDGKCSYRIEGRDVESRWWSITAYAKDHFLIDHPAKRYAVSKTNVVRGADGSFVIRVSTSEEKENWIASSADGFQLTLRLYNPGASVRDDPAGVALPTITKEACS
ncbi:MAG: DUF1214 domain-containing protein [Micropepsaceae bacterium]